MTGPEDFGGLDYKEDATVERSGREALRESRAARTIGSERAICLQEL